MKTYKYELSHQSNLIQIGNLIDDMHSVHVHLIRLQRRYYRLFGKYASLSRILKHITKLKQRTKPYWYQLPSQMIQDVAIRIDLGYQAFFDNIKVSRKAGKTKRKVGRPKIKPNHKYKSITFTQAGFKIQENRLSINCLKKSFTFWKHRDWTGIVKKITIKRDNVGDYYLYLTCEDCEPSEKLPLTGSEAGADFGSKTFLTLSDGIKIESPQFYKQSLKAIRSANKALSRKQYLSNAWYRAKRHLARVHKDIANRRRDWFFKLALRLVRRYDKIAIETLNLEGMKRLWGRKISDIAFGEFSLILKWTCDRYGKTLLKAGRWQPTTKPCSDCRFHNKDLTLNDRQWTCPSCNAAHDRDVNAALNILRVGVPWT
ncbi:MAG: RNA-guided endonuclease TnpB family protein [Candidatus Poribacteria bacterium]|nr:RNA-guided endonuclease TnpB family protein [Candidatus Poribacteria bacterium]